jgi:hypothetical protein
VIQKEKFIFVFYDPLKNIKSAIAKIRFAIVKVRFAIAKPKFANGGVSPLNSRS